MKLLISSYSFGAGRGSEAGVGWNVASGMARRGHEVTVLTTSEFHHLNFPDGEAPPFRVLECDFGMSQFNSAAAYNNWQRKIPSVIRELCSKESFDLIHHVTFNQYRGIRDVFAAPLPYVVGPVGGAEVVATQFLGDMPLKKKLKEILRYVPVDAWPFGWRVRRAACKGVILASTPQTLERLQRFAGVQDVGLEAIISIHDSEIKDGREPVTDTPYMVYDGGVRPDKGLKLLIRTLSLLWKQGVRVPVKAAAVAEKDWPGVRRYMAGCGLPDEAVELMAFMPRAELMSIVARATTFISVSFRDSGCMALLEAVAMGVPSLCLDVPGQFWLPSEFAVKVPVMRDMEQSLAGAITRLLSSPEQSAAYHARRSEWLRNNMSWRHRLDCLEKVYKQAVEQNKSSR